VHRRFKAHTGTGQEGASSQRSLGGCLTGRSLTRQSKHIVLGAQQPPAGLLFQAVAAAVWPGPALRVRVGVHLARSKNATVTISGRWSTGQRVLRRLVMAAGHDGQLLITEAVPSAARLDSTADLGVHQPRDRPLRPPRTYKPLAARRNGCQLTDKDAGLNSHRSDSANMDPA